MEFSCLYHMIDSLPPLFMQQCSTN